MTTRDDVERIARRFLSKVRRSGPYDIMAICPFHMKPDGTPERKPSFAMSLSRGLYFCHACHAKGNLFTFLRDIGLTRSVIEREYRFVIDSAAKNMPPPPNPLRPLVFELPHVEESVLGLMEYCPLELMDSGFLRSTIQHFEVGYDRWHNRITYPLRDLKGQLVGVSGRNPEGYKPKYKVYTQEYTIWGLPAYSEPDKRAILWNADKIYPEVYFSKPDSGIIVVVEGFKGCMWVWQAGIKDVVALLGTYLSWEHKWILQRLGRPVYLFLDNDGPGRRGAAQAAESLAGSLPVHVVRYPQRLSEVEEAQPDDCSPDEVLEIMAAAPSYLSWLLQPV